MSEEGGVRVRKGMGVRRKGSKEGGVGVSEGEDVLICSWYCAQWLTL